MNSIHVWGMGFTQSTGRMNGQLALWLQAREHSGPRHIMLTPFQWKANPRDACELLRAVADRETRIYGYFYSWGCGAFYRRLVRHMEDAGLSFEAIVLCDPVWRSRLLPESIPFNPTSLFPVYTFRVPTNVRRCYVFHQSQDLPRGHRVEVEDARATTIMRTELRAPHHRMEDQPEYRDRVLSLVTEATHHAKHLA